MACIYKKAELIHFKQSKVIFAVAYKNKLRIDKSKQNDKKPKINLS